MTYVVVAVGFIITCETWVLWRALSRLSVLRRVEDRLATLTHSVALLTDTTETCFQAIAGQIEGDRKTQVVAPVERAKRQRRVVGAARRGRSVADIAVAEEVAESEVRLRLHLADQPR